MNKQFYKTNLNDNKIKGCKKGNTQQAPIVNTKNNETQGNLRKKLVERKKKLVELEIKW